MTADHERVALAAFVTTSVLAGGNAISIRFSNRELAPLWGAGLRFSLAAALLGAVMVVLKLRPPRGRALTGAVLYGLLNFGAGLALAYYALVQLHAGFVQMLLALVPLVAGSVLAGEPRMLPQRAATWVALGFAVVVGSIVVFVLYLVVLRYWAASRAAYGFVLTPFITVMLSAWLDDEPIHVGLIFGGLLVLAGVYVGALRPSQVPAAPPPA
jgi:drug/metabolite transporter (DMT)-like permease